MTMAKRNLFKELVAGFQELKDARKGKLTLRKYKLTRPDPAAVPTVTKEFIKQFRESLKLSRPVFARKLHINERTLERWEQGRSSPTPPIAALILLAKRHPRMLDELETIGE